MLAWGLLAPQNSHAVCTVMVISAMTVRFAVIYKWAVASQWKTLENFYLLATDFTHIGVQLHYATKRENCLIFIFLPSLCWRISKIAPRSCSWTSANRERKKVEVHSHRMEGERKLLVLLGEGTTHQRYYMYLGCPPLKYPDICPAVNKPKQKSTFRIHIKQVDSSSHFLKKSATWQPCHTHTQKRSGERET